MVLVLLPEFVSAMLVKHGGFSTRRKSLGDEGQRIGVSNLYPSVRPELVGMAQGVNGNTSQPPGRHQFGEAVGLHPATLVKVSDKRLELRNHVIHFECPQ